MPNFKDHFSDQAEDYSQYRPAYPQQLYDFILAQVTNKNTAWDCATGNGQAAVELARHFAKVIATDASSHQIQNAQQAERVTYIEAPAENTPIDDRSVDLITVAQALHWFDFEKFYTEVRRVAKPEAWLAVWGYATCTIDEKVDPVFNRFYNDIIGPYWPPERKHVEHAYADIPFPFHNIISRNFLMNKEWSLQQFTGYLQTWSAYQRYMEDRGHSPLDQILEELTNAWGDPEKIHTVRFPVFLKMGRIL